MKTQDWPPIHVAILNSLASPDCSTHDIEFVAWLYGECRSACPPVAIPSMIEALKKAACDYLFLRGQVDVAIENLKAQLTEFVAKNEEKPGFKKGDVVRLSKLTKKHISWGWEQYVGAFGEITSGPSKQSDLKEETLDGQSVKGVSYSVNLIINGSGVSLNPVFEEELRLETSQGAIIAVANL